MTLFQTDLYRPLGIGFASGAVLLAVAMAGEYAARPIATPAMAADTLDAVPATPQPAPEFVISWPR